MSESLTERDGYNPESSYTSELSDYPAYYSYTIFYDTHFNYWEEREIKKSIKQNGGHMQNMLHLGREPMISKEDTNALIDSAIMGAISFVTGLAGLQFISAVETIKSMQIAAIPATAAFLTELGIERKRHQH